MRNLVHLCLTFISMTLAVLIFLISHETLWISELKKTGIGELLLHIKQIALLEPHYELFRTIFPYLVYFLLLLILISATHLSIKYLIFKLDRIDLSKEQIEVFEQADDFYLPVYLGYAFVSISLPTIKSFILFFILMLFILYKTRFFYFNPLFLILGYKFYFINSTDKSKILIITKKEVKIVEDFFVDNDLKNCRKVALIKISNHTYLL